MNATFGNGSVCMLRGLGVATLAMLALLLPAAVAEDADREWWTGNFVGPPPQGTVEFYVTLSKADSEGHVATITIPVQGIAELPLSSVTYTDEALGFSIPQVGAVFELKRNGDKAEGELRQMGMTFPCTLRRVTAAEARAVGPERPQTPKPPFPYESQEVTFENPRDDITLAGTLTIPEGVGPHPAVVLISGSGSQDRDETILGHKPFAVLADHLTRNGIAVLRYDDRGVGGSGGSVNDSTTKDFANDVIAGVRMLGKRPEIDARRIGLVGHSEGGVVAPMVAAHLDRVHCIVLLAGTGLPGSEILSSQMMAGLRAAGVADEKVEAHGKVHRRLIELVLKDASAEEIRNAVRELVRSEAGLGGQTLTDEQIEAATTLHTSVVTTKWMRWFLAHDPRPTLEKVKCPVLALIGERDLQVLAGPNIAALKEAFAKGGNANATVKELAGLNHLFQDAPTGMVGEYARIEQTMSQRVLDEVTAWLRAQFAL